MLSLPYVLAINGFVLGSLLIILGAIAAIISLKLIVASVTIAKSGSYIQLVRTVMGSKADNGLCYLLLFGMTGSCITY